MIVPTSEARLISRTPFVSLRSPKAAFSVAAFVLEMANKVEEHLAISLGDAQDWKDIAIPVRLHSGCITGDVFGSHRCDCAWQLHRALEILIEFGVGVVLYSPAQEGRGHGLFQKVQTFPLMDHGTSAGTVFRSLGAPKEDLRSYWAQCRILQELGITVVRVITNNPEKISALICSGFQIAERIPVVVPTNDPQLSKYIEAKVHELGHLI